MGNLFPSSKKAMVMLFKSHIFNSAMLFVLGASIALPSITGCVTDFKCTVSSEEPSEDVRFQAGLSNSGW
jgi:uncharacterized membrane protein